MTGADMVLAHHLVKHLDKLQTERMLGVLDRHHVELSGEDHAAIQAFAHAVRYELGDVPAAMEIDAIVRKTYLN